MIFNPMRKVLIITYVIAFGCLLIAVCSNKEVITAGPIWKAYGSFLIIAVVSLALMIMTELCVNCIDSYSENKLARIFTLFFMVLAGVSVIISLILISVMMGHISHGWAVAGCTLILEALFIYIWCQYCFTQNAVNP